MLYVLLTAARTLHAVVEDPADLPPFDPSVLTLEARDRSFPDWDAEVWDASADDFVPRPAPPAARLSYTDLTSRLTQTEFTAFKAAIGGYLLNGTPLASVENGLQLMFGAQGLHDRAQNAKGLGHTDPAFLEAVGGLATILVGVGALAPEHKAQRIADLSVARGSRPDLYPREG